MFSNNIFYSIKADNNIQLCRTHRIAALWVKYDDFISSGQLFNKKLPR